MEYDERQITPNNGVSNVAGLRGAFAAQQLYGNGVLDAAQVYLNILVTGVQAPQTRKRLIKEFPNSSDLLGVVEKEAKRIVEDKQRRQN